MLSNEDNEAMKSLKYEPKKDQFLDHIIKHPARQTIFADLLLEVKLKISETPVEQSNKRKMLIPTYKKFMMQQIPHFNSMFKEGSNWREAADDTPHSMKKRKKRAKTQKIVFWVFEVKT